MIKTTFDKTIEPRNYILYSSSVSQPLRFAPVVKSQQFEAIQIRNQLVAIERGLGKKEIEAKTLLTKLRIQFYPNVKGFQARDMEKFEKVYNGLTPLEKKYFDHFVGFIAREHQMAKIGLEGVSNANGIAALWRNTFQDKERNFEIISLSLIHI